MLLRLTTGRAGNWPNAFVPQGAVTAVDGNKRGDFELVRYIGDGAQDLVLDLSFRSAFGTTAGALRRGTGTGTESSFTLATRIKILTTRRPARLPSTGRSIGIIAVSWTSCRPSPAPGCVQVHAEPTQGQKCVTFLALCGFSMHLNSHNRKEMSNREFRECYFAHERKIECLNVIITR